MNEVIKELARQAGCKVMDDGEWYIPSATGLEKIVYTSGVGLEKFAELIVRECVNWIDGSPATEEGTLILSKSFIIANLKQHFGVE